MPDSPRPIPGPGKLHHFCTLLHLALVQFPSCLRCHGHHRVVIGKILRHLGQWNGTPPMAPARAPPDADTGPWTRELCDDVDPMPDYENVLTD